MRCTRTRMRSTVTECTYLQCLVFPPACPFSLNQTPNSDQSRRDERDAAQQVTRAKARRRDAVESAAWNSHRGTQGHRTDRRGRVKQPRPESVQVNRSEGDDLQSVSTRPRPACERIRPSM